MYFLPRANAVYSHMVYLKPMHRYAITLLMGCMLVSVWYLTVHRLLDSSTRNIQSEIKRLQKQENMIKQSTLDAQQLDKTIAALQATLNTDNHKKQSGNNFQSAMLAIVNQASTCGLAMQSCTVAEQKDESWYTQNTLNVDVSGSFDQLLKFVQSLTAANYLMAMHNSTLTRIAMPNKFHLRCGIDVIMIK